MVNAVLTHILLNDDAVEPEDNVIDQDNEVEYEIDEDDLLGTVVNGNLLDIGDGVQQRNIQQEEDIPSDIDLDDESPVDITGIEIVNKIVIFFNNLVTILLICYKRVRFKFDRVVFIECD